MNTSQRTAELRRLHQIMDECRLCTESRQPVVSPAIYAGSLQADVMIIGQAPGGSEVAARRPFNASAGKRLFQWLAEAGFDEVSFRTTQYITSVTKCYPGKANGGRGDRVPSRQERDLCQPYLERELELVQPKLVIPVGRLAINLFFDRRLQLTKIIGREARQAGRWVIPLPHPSGASTWHWQVAHQPHVRRAIRLLRRRRLALGL